MGDVVQQTVPTTAMGIYDMMEKQQNRTKRQRMARRGAPPMPQLPENVELVGPVNGESEADQQFGLALAELGVKAEEQQYKKKGEQPEKEPEKYAEALNASPFLPPSPAQVQSELANVTEVVGQLNEYLQCAGRVYHTLADLHDEAVIRTADEGGDALLVALLTFIANAPGVREQLLETARSSYLHAWSELTGVVKHGSHLSDFLIGHDERATNALDAIRNELNQQG